MKKIKRHTQSSNYKHMLVKKNKGYLIKMKKVGCGKMGSLHPNPSWRSSALIKVEI